ncbi:hypothetical protein IVA87_01475 [Bradyrhizobium sp. 147]|uniref:hypothetical protein n=1 Tax=unclassified Bradyrhizobium TaxID=2631580 RepID=UPI001FF8069B|nr:MULTISPECIES: hypothetical protein [unclassified Bradyrhizobium]MCK1546270.1 hypothetical protein [Bradyrhizobium sp. 179]MCK1625384.1 hypothetical protein [Bradyrhizobium sp. 160]MCK1678177.1 hypothetical protein [Bradyrhizobium sp. 147]
MASVIYRSSGRAGRPIWLRLLDLPRKDFVDGDGLELVALAFFAEEIVELHAVKHDGHIWRS